MSNRSDYLSVAEIAAKLSISKMTVYRAIHTGQLHAIRAGERVYRVHQDAYDAYLDGSVYVPADKTEEASTA